MPRPDPIARSFPPTAEIAFHAHDLPPAAVTATRFEASAEEPTHRPFTVIRFGESLRIFCSDEQAAALRTALEGLL